MPQKVKEYYECLLLHRKTPIWDGISYRINNEGKKVPDIKHICKECNAQYS